MHWVLLLPLCWCCCCYSLFGSTLNVCKCYSTITAIESEACVCVRVRVKKNAMERDIEKKYPHGVDNDIDEWQKCEEKNRVSFQAMSTNMEIVNEKHEALLNVGASNMCETMPNYHSTKAYPRRFQWHKTQVVIYCDAMWLNT